MKATTIGRLTRCEQAQIDRVLLQGWTRFFRSGGDQAAPSAEFAFLQRLGATLIRRDQVLSRIVHHASGEPSSWRRQGQPMGPLMRAAVAALRDYWKAHPDEAPPPAYVINIGDDDDNGPDDFDMGDQMEAAPPSPMPTTGHPAPDPQPDPVIVVEPERPRPKPVGIY